MTDLAPPDGGRDPLPGLAVLAARVCGAPAAEVRLDDGRSAAVGPTGTDRPPCVASVPVDGPAGAVGAVQVWRADPVDAAALDALALVADQLAALVAADEARRRADDRAASWSRQHDALAETLQERTEFLAVAQHKLKTPLAIVAGWASTLERWDRLGVDEREAGIAAIQRAADELQIQLDDLLDEARSHLLGASMTPEPVALGPVLRDVTAHLDPDRHPVHVDADGVAAVADPRALTQVLGHLVDNAVKYSPDGGDVALTARADGDRVRVTVRDHGVGVEPSAVDLVFLPFRRGPEASRVARGSGLGLHVVRTLVAAMDGESGLDDPPDGGGAAFWFSLPRAVDGG